MRQMEIERGDVTLVMNTQGPRKGPTLLFLHASGESRDVWSPVFAQLRPNHWRLVAPDLRGHGESGRAKHYRFDDFVDDVHQILQELDGRPVVLVGSSIGGLVALIVAATYPMLVDGVVLLDAPSRLSAASVKRESRKLVDGISRRCGVFSHVDPEFMAGRLIEEVLSQPERLKQAAQSICVPTLFLHGSQSETIGQEEVQALAEDIPHVEIASVDAGHLIARDNPQAVARRIAEFVPTLIPEVIH